MMHLHSAGSARPLAARLADVLGDQPPDPMTPEWLAVPSHGMRRWLTLELARRLGASGDGRTDGVAANIVPAFPGDLRSAVLAVDRADDAADPWRIERMVWTVLEVMVRDGGGLGLPEALVADSSSVYARARRIADLFDRYHLHRPQMVRHWSEGRLVDGTGRPLADHALWQARLWNQVRERMPEPSPPERLPNVLDRLHTGEHLLDLPGRLMLFGFTMLPAGDFLEVARAVAVQRDVHLFLLEPTHLDSDALLRCSPHPMDGGTRLRANDPSSELINHPLLRSWGRLHRESALLLADARSPGITVHQEVATPAAPPPSTLLGRLQHDIRANATPRATLPDDASDRSVQFHACFGATRQVEVLRDALLHLLSAPGSDLTEDDIVVFCPSLERFAPLIEAVFGRSADPTASPGSGPGSSRDTGGAPALRYRIADQSIRRANPVLSAASALLGLVTGRFDVASVLEFLALGPVRTRLGFDDDDLAVIAEWTGATGVRWGLDAEQRVRLGMPESVVTNTWRAALDRLLLGSAVYDEGLRLTVGSVAPFGVEGGEVALAGQLADALGSLADLAGETDRSHPIAEWVDHVRRACLSVFDTTGDMGWQREALERVLFSVLDSASTDDASSSIELEFADVRKLLDERLDDKVGRTDFFRGGVTVTSMRPLRWVPFRVVALLGMDQSAFGSEASAGDDLSAAAPQIGDRDARGEVRETLLEAVLVAEDHLVVVRDGRDVRTNQVVPRAVATTELFEAVLASVDVGCRDLVSDRLEIDHPRQAFDERCFEADRLVKGVVWAFDRHELDGALARRERSDDRPPFLAAPLPPFDADVIDMADLHRFFTNPSAAFFSERLEARIPTVEDEVPSVLPMDIRGLEGWSVGTRLLEARVAGFTFDQWLEHESVLGTLPPGPLGDEAIATLGAAVENVVDTARGLGLRSGPVEPFPVDATLPDGTRVVGSVQLRLRPPSSGPVRLFYSKPKATHRVAAWLDLMALVATDPSTPWRSLAVSRPDRTGGDAVATDLVASAGITAGTQRAADALAVAVDCFRRGMAEPIPLFPNFSYQVYRGKEAPGRWSGYRYPEDGDHPAVALAFDGSDYKTIMQMGARPDDPQGPKGRVWRFAAYLYRAIDTSTATAPSPGDDVPSADPSGPGRAGGVS
jgi:exodeoxyribonuclease V gamma subunit